MENKEQDLESEKKDSWNWHHGRTQSWMPGLVLILIGVIFLLRNFTALRLDNWWALFILFPAVSNFASAYERYRLLHTFDRHVRGRLFWGLFLTLLSTDLLLGLDFAFIWPVFLILAGLGLLLGAF